MSVDAYSHKTYVYIAMHIYVIIYFVAISGFRHSPPFRFNSLSTYTIQSSSKMSKYRRIRRAREKEGGERREGDVILCNKSQLKGSLYINSAL